MRGRSNISSALGSAVAICCNVVGARLLRDEFKQLHQSISDEGFDGIESDPWLHTALVLSEDHRFFDHKGIDIFSMSRAIWIYCNKRNIEGASTITQQLVRVLTGRYERTFRRKFREIILACMLDKYVAKDLQICCYLKNAYFGWRMNGVKEAAGRLGLSGPLTSQSASMLIARLKYPEPQFPSRSRKNQISQREIHIQYLIKTSELHASK